MIVNFALNPVFELYTYPNLRLTPFDLNGLYPAVFGPAPIPVEIQPCDTPNASA